MTIKAFYDPAKRRLRTTASGMISLPDLSRHLDDEEATNRLDAAELFDARDALTDLTAPDVRVLVKRMRELARTKGLGATALVTSSSVAYGMARMYSILAEEYDPRFMVYRDIEEAERWLDAGAPLHDVQ